MKKIITAVSIVAIVAGASVAQAQFDAIRSLHPDQGQEVRRPVEAKIFTASQEELPAYEAELLDVFGATESTLEGRQYSCRMLRYCASDACVPVLAPQLTNPELSSFVRFVFQGLETPEADKALIDALHSAGDDIRIGIIGTLGQRGSTESVKAIARYLENENDEIQFAAITALGNVGGRSAVKALAKAEVLPQFSNEWKLAQIQAAAGVKSGFLGLFSSASAKKVCKKFLNDADQNIRRAAYIGWVETDPDMAAASIMADLESDDAGIRNTAADVLPALSSRHLIHNLASMRDVYQVDVITLLSDRKALESEPAILKLIDSDNEVVEAAALNALKSVGGNNSIQPLLDKAAHNASAYEVLQGLQAEEVDAALLLALEKAEGRAELQLLECLSARKTAAALPAFIALAKGEWSRTSAAAIDGMATLVSEKDFPVYAGLLLNSDNKKKSEALEKSIATAAQRLPDSDACARPLIKAADSAEGDAKYALIRALGGIGGNEAKNMLIEAAKSSDAQLQDAAVRGLANWPSIDVAPDLLEIATTSKNEKHRVLAMRGYVRLAGSLSDYKTALDMCYKAADATDRPAELMAVISCAKKFKEPQVLDFLALQLDNEEVFSEAASAIFELATHWKVKEHAGPTLEKIAETAMDKDLADEARALLKRIGK